MSSAMKLTPSQKATLQAVQAAWPNPLKAVVRGVGAGTTLNSLATHGLVTIVDCGRERYAHLTPKGEAELKASPPSTAGPLRFVPAIAVRVSGLSERSNGDGCNRKSVVHARLTEDRSFPRPFRRSKGEFLCTTKQPWDISDRPESTPITCPECLRKLARYGGSTP